MLLKIGNDFIAAGRSSLPTARIVLIILPALRKRTVCVLSSRLAL